MLYLSEIHRILFLLQHQIREQNERLDRLEESISVMRSEVSAGMKLLAELRPSHIEKIEYHFDQLKVETLEGTLNIGVTPHSEGDIEQVDIFNQRKSDDNCEGESSLQAETDTTDS